MDILLQQPYFREKAGKTNMSKTDLQTSPLIKRLVSETF